MSAGSAASARPGVEKNVSLLKEHSGLTSASGLIAGTTAAPLRRASELSQLPDTVGLPITPELSDVLPWPGLRPGATIALSSAGCPGLTSLMLALLSPASRAGAWCAIAGAGNVSPAAAGEAGLSLSRLGLVPDLGGRFAEVVGSLLEGMDVVAVRITALPSVTVVRRLAARARRYGTVLIPFGASMWPEADTRLEVTRATWHGLRWGGGRLRHCELRVATRGGGRVRRTTVWPHGKPERTETTPSPMSILDRKVKG